MDVTLQNHNAKHICDVPDGLSELCADISREVMRVQPDDIYCFIADYLDTLMITRENAKVAIKVVRNIMLKSELIVEILTGTGLKLEEIAAAAPRLQKAFRAYLEALEKQKKDCGCDADSEISEDSEISICRILHQTGATFDEAQLAATKIQALFRGHYERLSLAEKRGEIKWQRAIVNTMEILRKSGVSKSEATHAATIIQAAYRGYYTRKILRSKEPEAHEHVAAKKDLKIDMSAWLEMMFENTGLTIERANKASTTIQRAYRRYREKKYPKVKSLSSVKISAALDQDKQSSRTSEFLSTPRTSGRKTDTSDSTSSDDDSESRSKVVKFSSNKATSEDQSTDDVDSTDKLEELKEDEMDDEASESAENIQSPDGDENIDERNEEGAENVDYEAKEIKEEKVDEEVKENEEGSED